MRVLRPRADQGVPVIESNTNWVEVAELAFDVVCSVAVGVITWINWGMKTVVKSELSTAAEAHDKVHEELEERLAASGERFARIETHLTHMPSRADIELLTRQLGQISADIAAVGASVKALTVQVHQLSEHAMERK
jgi:hypothetical protein